MIAPKLALAWSPGEPLVPPCGNSTVTGGTRSGDTGSGNFEYGDDDTSTYTETSTFTPCGISDFFTMLGNIYSFIVYMIATPLAIIALTIGGIFILISAGNANLMSKGKQILWAAIIGLFLVWGSWAIINTILCTILGYCAWHTL